MKYLLSLFLLLFATSAFASKPDSGICPWKMPFTIIINANGQQQIHQTSRGQAPGGYWERDTNFENASTNNSSFTLDTSLSQLDTFDHNIIRQFSFSHDVLQFSLSYEDSMGPYDGNYSEFLSIVFAPNKDSIISLEWFEQGGGMGGALSTYDQHHIIISSLLFDSISIFSGDSSFSLHDISIADSEQSLDYESPPNNYSQPFGTFTYTDFTASSVTLSGIFRTTTFSDLPSIVTESPAPNHLAIYASNGSLACSFDVAPQERNLDVYSVLGMKIASVMIPPNENQASLPHLAPGIYFVRLEGAVAKIFVSE